MFKGPLPTYWSLWKLFLLIGPIRMINSCGIHTDSEWERRIEGFWKPVSVQSNRCMVNFSRKVIIYFFHEWKWLMSNGLKELISKSPRPLSNESVVTLWWRAQNQSHLLPKLFWGYRWTLFDKITLWCYQTWRHLRLTLKPPNGCFIYLCLFTKWNKAFFYFVILGF